MTVSTWSEFITAIATPGATVDCPTNAVWDLNVIEPGGVTDDIEINCDVINGNGTAIKNGHLFGQFIVKNSDLEVHQLQILSFLAEKPLIVPGTGIGSMESGYFDQCTFSGVFAATVSYAMTGEAEYYRCAYNVEFQYSDIVLLCGGGDNAGKMTYCTCEIHAPNAYTVAISGGSTRTNCRFDIYAQRAGYLYITGATYCTFRGNLESCTQVQPNGGRNTVTVLDAADFSPSLAVYDYPSVWGCTDEQIKSVSFLQSLGFPIM